MFNVLPIQQQHLATTILPYSRFAPYLRSSIPKTMSYFQFYQSNMAFSLPGPSYLSGTESSRYGPVFPPHHYEPFRNYSMGHIYSEHRYRRYSRDSVDHQSSEKEKNRTSSTAVLSLNTDSSQINWDMSRNEEDDIGEPAPPEVRTELNRGFMKEISDVRKNLKNFRRWEYTQLGRLIGDKSDRRAIGDGTRFFIMSYNVLSQHLMNTHSSLYSNCDPRALNHSFRKQLFFSELDEIKPDILCLQEVEESEYYKVHEPTLFLKGYKGIFKKRTGDKVDGCAIFYKAARFSFLDKLAVELFQPHVPLLNRDNIGLFIKLKPNCYGPGRPKTFVVGTTHLLFNPKRHDVKLAQIQLLLAELDRFAFCGIHSNGHPKYHPVILTGDFNLEPSSSLIRFISDGVYKCGGPSTSSLSYSPNPIQKFMPVYVGISDQCQHFKIVLERLKQWHNHRREEFEFTVDPSTVNIRASEITNPNLSYYPYETQSNELTPRNTTPFADRSKIGSRSSRSVTFSEDIDIDNLDQNDFVASSGRAEPQERMKTMLVTEISEETRTEILTEINKFGGVCTFESGEVTHGFRLSSVYAPQLDRPEKTDTICTTKQSCWTMVDYMFYSKIWNEQYQKQTEGKLRLLRRLGLLNRDQCKQMGPIPNLAVSSDHYPLVAEFVIK